MIIYIENFYPNNIRTDDNSYKNILIYYIGYVKIKKGLQIDSVNPLYLVFIKVNGCCERKKLIEISI